MERRAQRSGVSAVAGSRSSPLLPPRAATALKGRSAPARSAQSSGVSQEGGRWKVFWSAFGSGAPADGPGPGERGGQRSERGCLPPSLRSLEASLGLVIDLPWGHPSRGLHRFAHGLAMAMGQRAIELAPAWGPWPGQRVGIACDTPRRKGARRTLAPHHRQAIGPPWPRLSTTRRTRSSWLPRMIPPI